MPSLVPAGSRKVAPASGRNRSSGRRSGRDEEMIAEHHLDGRVRLPDRLLVMGRWAGEGGRVKVGHVANLYAMGSRLWEDPYPSLPQVSRYRRGRLLGKGGFANCYILREVGFLLDVERRPP
jgi:hypothetical protein